MARWTIQSTSPRSSVCSVLGSTRRRRATSDFSSPVSVEKRLLGVGVSSSPRARARSQSTMGLVRPVDQVMNSRRTHMPLSISFAALTWAFLSDDFSVLYVANHSQLALPTIYKVSAVWGAHEGSLLMWILILAGWTVAVARFSAGIPDAFAARVIGVLGLLSVGFLLFLILTSNPFDRLVPAAVDGGDLNPLLQDPGLAIHPPLLYIGYVGFSVAFAFAIAAMISGDLDLACANDGQANTLYLNDGMYGAFWELRFKGHVRYPARALRGCEPLGGNLHSFRLFGPTCDSSDKMPGLVELPADIDVGDYILFWSMGAYSLSGITRFNGFYSDDVVTIKS